MAKRHSLQDAESPATSAGTEDDRMSDELPKPAKRLKTMDGSAAASPMAAAEGGVEMDLAEGRGGRAATLVKAEEAEAEAGAVPSSSSRNGNSNGNGNSHNSSHNSHSHSHTSKPILHDDAMSTISEDTDSEVHIPSTSVLLHAGEDDVNEPQVTVCAWDGCGAGDLQTMDRLVEHLHDKHVDGKQRRYTCEWIGCSRKGSSHASAYALKAHLRGHTREKPYMCYLPECDQAFARADALGKHMRTAHEIDMMRSHDTAARNGALGRGATANGVNGDSSGGSYGSSNGFAGAGGVGAASGGGGNGQGGAYANGRGSNKFKIIIKTQQSHAAGQDDSVDYGANSGGGNGNGSGMSLLAGDAGAAAALADGTPLTRDQGFTAQELGMPLDKLYSLCRHQLRWVEDEAEKLRREAEVWEEAYYKEWLERQVLLEQVIQSEKAWHERRKAVLASLAAEEAEQAKKRAALAPLRDDKDEEDDSGDDDDNDDDDNEVDDDDLGASMLDADITMDGYSFADADASSFSRLGSMRHNAVSVNGD